MAELYLPDGRVHVGEWVNQGGSLDGSMLTRAQWEAYNKLQSSKYYLVRNRGGDYGERLRCSRHPYTAGVDEPVYHEYFTLMCIDRPWRGLDGALYAYASITSDDQVKSMVMRDLPALQRAHPESFLSGRPETSGEDLVAIALGTLEPISELKAQQLAARINAARPPRPFTL